MFLHITSWVNNNLKFGTMVIQKCGDEFETHHSSLRFQENQMLYSSNQENFITETHSITTDLTSGQKMQTIRNL